MLLDICFGTKSAWRILFVLSEAPGKSVSRKEIHSFTGMGNKTLTKFLDVLEKFKVISSKRIGKTYYYRLDMSNPFTEQVLELVMLEKSSLNNPDFLVTSVLREFVYGITNIDISGLKNIILFGSYAKRTFQESSDVDVAIVLEKDDPGAELLVTDIVEEIRRRFGKTIQPHYFSEKDFVKGTDPLAKEILKDGVILL